MNDTSGHISQRRCRGAWRSRCGFWMSAFFGKAREGRTDTCAHHMGKIGLMDSYPIKLTFNSIQFNSIQFYLYSAFNKGALSQSCFTENRPQWVSLGQQWQGKTPWQITGRNLEQNQTQRGTICRWLAPVLVQCIESVLSPVMLGWGDSGRMRVPSWSRLDLRATILYHEGPGILRRLRWQFPQCRRTTEDRDQAGTLFIVFFFSSSIKMKRLLKLRYSILLITDGGKKKNKIPQVIDNSIKWE